MRVKFCLGIAALAAVLSLFSAPAAQAEQTMTVTITSLSRGECLNGIPVHGSSIAPVLFPCDGQPAQRWIMTTESVNTTMNEMTVRFTNPAWGSCMGIEDGIVQSVACAAVDSQRWLRKLDAPPTEYWPIVSAYRPFWNNCLYPTWLIGSADRYIASVRRCAGGPSEDWRITPV